MCRRGLIEICHEIPAQARVNLLLSAYAASVDWRFLLAFPGDLRDEVDRTLDEAIGRHGIKVQGLEFLAWDVESVLREASACQLIVICSDPMREALTKVGIESLNPVKAIGTLLRVSTASHVDRGGASGPR